jgi:hypothetical protein
VATVPEGRTRFAVPNCDEHQSCRDVAALLIGEHLPMPYPREVALRGMGLRDKVHPYDVQATVHADRDTAEKFAAANRDHFGHPCWTATVDGKGVLVVDLREALTAQGGPIVDPDLPDDWLPTGGEAQRWHPGGR